MRHVAVACSSILTSCPTQRAFARFATAPARCRILPQASSSKASRHTTCSCRKGKCREGTCKGTEKEVAMSSSTREAITVHEHPLRTSTKACVHGVAFRTSPCFTMFRRSVASAASVPKRQQQELSALDELRLMLGKKSRQDKLSELWRTFLIALRSEPSLLDEKDIIRLAKRLATSQEVYSLLTEDNEDRHHCLSKVEHLLLELDARKKSWTSLSTLSYSCMVMLAHLLRDEYSEAQSLFRSLPNTPTKGHDDWVYLMHSLLLLSTSRHVSPTHAFEFFIDNFPIAENRAWDENNVGRMVTYMDKPLARVLASLPLPASFLVDRTKSWKPRQRTLAAFIMVIVLIRHHRTEDALLVFEEALSQQLDLPLSARHQLIRALVRIKEYERANVLFDTLPIPSSSEPDGGKLARARDALGLFLFAHQGNVTGAEDCFERMQSLGPISQNEITLLMHASAYHGDTERVLKHFNEYFGDGSRSQARHLGRPNVYHYGTILNAFAEKDDLDGMNDWLGRMVADGIQPDKSVFNTALKAFARRGDLRSMRTVLSQMRQAQIPADPVSYTTILKVLARRGDVVAAETMFKRMINEGLTPDGMAVATLMNAHAEAGSWNGVIRVFDYLRSNYLKALAFRIEIFNTLLKAYVLIGAPFDVVSGIFRRFEATSVRPNHFTFALLIQSACDNGHLDIASQLFVEMEEASKDWTRNLLLSPHVFTIIISAYLRQGKKEQARKFFEDMQSRGIQPTSYTFASILRAYATDTDEGSIESAQQLLSSLVDSSDEACSWKQPNSGREGWLAFLYAPLLQAYIQRLDMAKVEEQYKNYLEADEQPSIGILTLLLDAYRRTKNSEGVRIVWPQIVERATSRTTEVDELLSEANMRASPALRGLRRADVLCIPLSIYIDAISRTGNHIDIAHTWNALREAGFQFDAHNWNHLVVALIRAGQPARAFEVVEKVIIPYERQAKSIARQRPESPDSPYLFDDETSIAQIQDEPFGRHVARPADKRVEFVDRLRRQRLHAMSEGDDYAHELHLMQQISPAWSVWRPHSLTLRALSNVLRVLDSGRLIKPTRSEGEGKNGQGESVNGAPDSRGRGAEAAKVEAKDARTLLNRILIGYPHAIARIDRWEQTAARRS